MNKYYLLTERGVKMIEAEMVEEFGGMVWFRKGSAVDSISRQELVWWKPVEMRRPAPFENLVGMRGMSASPERMRENQVALGALSEALRAEVPAGWAKAVLEIRVGYELPEQGYKLPHRIHNPETNAEVITFSPRLVETIEVFHWIAVESGQNWIRCVITLTHDGPRQYTIAVEYHNGTNFALSSKSAP